MNRVFKYAASVRTALANHEPVVALESTILTHGLPRPINHKVAHACEEAIRAQGATPATIFIRDGCVHIGAEKDELEEICSVNRPARKVSRRDLPGVLARGELGGTTVSGTALCAHAAGIEVFATGGLGGVHRGAETTMDISADLYELSRTPIFVVCSGVKSILDIGRTLEVLESLGVGVYTMGESDAFPAFYVRQSGFRSPGGALDAEAAAAVIKKHAQLQLKSGALFANPLPVANEADGARFERLIELAVAEANEKGITGAESTPFILARLAELSQGDSVDTNVALVVNNAKTAAEIAIQRYHNKHHSTGGNRNRTKSTIPTIAQLSYSST